MIHYVDATLQKLLTAQLGDIPGCPIRQAEQITFLSPTQLAGDNSVKADEDSAPAALPGLNLYLCHLQENVMLRDETFQRKGRVNERLMEITRAPARFDLSYLVTVTGLNGQAEHELLGNVLGVLMRAPYVETQYLVGGLTPFGTNAMLLTVAQPDHLLMADPGRLWQALSAAPRPALSLVATVMFNPFVSKWTPVVLEAIAGIGQGTGPDGPQHPLDRTTLRVSVAGLVIDKATDRPVPGAVLTLDGRDETATSDSRGFFYLLNLPPGPYKARVRHWRYAEYEKDIVAPPPGQPNRLEPLQVNFDLPADAVITTAVAARETAQRNAPGLPEKGRMAAVSLAGRLYLHQETRRDEEQAGKESSPEYKKPTERNPLPAANIVVRCGDARTTTNSEGIYCFFDLQPGKQEIVAEVPGLGDVPIWTRPTAFTGNVVPTQTLPPLPVLDVILEHRKKESQKKESPESERQEQENGETPRSKKERKAVV